MLPSFMKGGDIYFTVLVFFFECWLGHVQATDLFAKARRSLQSDTKRSQSFCGPDFNNQQLTRQNPRKRCAQVARKHEKSQQDI